MVDRAVDAFALWRTTPAPVRGELVRRFGNLVREHLDDLATLVSIEAGKIGSEARGEIQEVVDICDFAVGSVPAAVRSVDRVRASVAPADRDLAAARARSRW